MASNPATSADVAARWRPLTAEETARATILLGDAWAYLKTRIGDLEARLDTGTQDPVLVVGVEVAMVKRVMLNPDGKSQESIDDYSFTRDSSTTAGLLYAAESELRQLMPLGSLTRSRRLVAYGDYS